MWGRWKLGQKSPDQARTWGRADFVATHRHKKGGLYRVLGRGFLEADHTAMVIYDDASGRVWIRPEVEFEDGRFHPLG